MPGLSAEIEGRFRGLCAEPHTLTAVLCSALVFAAGSLVRARKHIHTQA